MACSTNMFSETNNWMEATIALTITKEGLYRNGDAEGPCSSLQKLWKVCYSKPYAMSNSKPF
ncbi:hypothetical protein DPMN_141595 [Dreissena polymorpha]|uniref:Uncharacterized protein n=1 Tax=Dreissena polymorpha TaxID=45954 RepID=A0A9D4G9S2_DREPO|nr:hypothetical protein DPMN_141595 [Dreissena polymorpha]